MKLQNGITLIELMIGMTISSFILFGLVEMYLTANSNHHTQMAMNTLEENSHDISHILSSAIHSAGYIGCARLTGTFPITNRTPYTLHKEDKVKSDTQSISIRRMNTVNDVVIKNMHGNSVITVSGKLVFSKNTVLMISNCKTADIFIAKEVIQQTDGTQKITTEYPLSMLYEKNSQIGLFEMNTYYVASTDRYDFYGSPIFALYIQDINQHKTELVEGVNDMHVMLDMQNRVPVGVSIQLQLSSLGRFELHKEWYIYAALRH